MGAYLWPSLLVSWGPPHDRSAPASSIAAWRPLKDRARRAAELLGRGRLPGVVPRDHRRRGSGPSWREKAHASTPPGDA